MGIDWKTMNEEAIWREETIGRQSVLKVETTVDSKRCDVILLKNQCLRWSASLILIVLSMKRLPFN